MPQVEISQVPTPEGKFFIARLVIRGPRVSQKTMLYVVICPPKWVQSPQGLPNIHRPAVTSPTAAETLALENQKNVIFAESAVFLNFQMPISRKRCVR